MCGHIRVDGNSVESFPIPQNKKRWTRPPRFSSKTI